MKPKAIFSGNRNAAATNNTNFDLPQGAKGGVFILDITAASGTSPTLDVKLQYRDDVSGKYVDVPGASFAQKTGTGTSQLSVYPGLTASTNVAVTQVLSKTLRAVQTVGGTTPNFTYSLSVHPVF